MQKNYNNPYLEVEKVKDDLHDYLDRTKPKTEIYKDNDN